MKLHRHLAKFLVLLIIFWILLSTVRTVYNISKLYTEERSWYFLSTEEQKAKQFGELHYLFRFIQKNTEKKSIIKFYTNDHQAYFFSRYYIYPTNIIGKFMTIHWNNKTIKYNYILLYPANNRKLADEVNKELTKYTVKEKHEFKHENKLKAILYKI